MNPHFGSSYRQLYLADLFQSSHSARVSLPETVTFYLRAPEIIGNTVRLVLAGDPESLMIIEKTLSDLGMPYIVRQISRFEKSGDSAFDRLTPQQMRILRLAYAKGYYDIPRKISTERIANLLKMKKGNVGEHLRRAEKNIMDFLMLV